MAYTLTSDDGIVHSNNPDIIRLWNDIARRQADERREWVGQMLALGAKAVAPDDGWVNREKGTLTIANYADVRRALEPGDLMALGGPDKWRIVRIESYRQNPFMPGPVGRVYSFTHTQEGRVG